MSQVRSLRDAKAIAHTLSNPSKMPWYGYSLPADACKLGSLLRKIKGSTCEKCYALKGRYLFPNVKAAMRKRLEAITHPLWVEAMVFHINLKLLEGGPDPVDEADGYERSFRWHDSGDLQSADHLNKICQVCERTPAVRHWLPAREFGVVREFLSTGRKLPTNLTVRLSAPKIGKLPVNMETLKLPMSTVGTEGPFRCGASTRGGECGPCRACWTGAVRVVDYPLH